MISKRSVALMFMTGIVVTMSCVDGRSPTGLDEGRFAAFALLPSLNGPAAVDISASINRVRITARAASSDAFLEEFLEDVDPSADEWEIELRTRVPTDGDQVMLTVELLNVVGDVTTVVWSGRVGPITLRIGQDVTASEVALYPGPLSNLTVTGVSVSPDSARILEGDTVRLAAELETTDPEAEPEPYWYSLDSTAIVDSTGLVLGVLPGAARIVAQVGAPSDTVVVFVDAAPAAVSIEPASATFLRVGETQSFAAAVLDARGDTLSGWQLDWRSQDEGVVLSHGGGQFEAVAGGTTTIEALVAADTLVRGVADVEVQLPAPAFYAAPGNTQLVIGAYAAAPATPHVSDGTGLLDETPALTVVSETLATTLGGSVTLEADGSALYTPPIGTTDATDEFYYHATSGDSALVTVELSERVWYVDVQNVGQVLTGRSNEPVADWVQLTDVISPGDIVYVAAGNYQTAIAVDTRQQLIGSGADLVVPGFGTLVPAGTPPVLFDPSAVVQMVGDSSTVRGVTLETFGVGAALNQGIVADGVSGITIEDVSILQPASRGLVLRNLGGVNTITGLTVDRIGSATPGIGIEVFGGTGSIAVDADVDVDNGVLIQVDGTAAGSAVDFGGTYTAVQADTAIRIINVAGDVSFESVSIGTGTDFGVALQDLVGSARFTSLEMSGTTGMGLIASGGTGTVVVGVGSGGMQFTSGSSIEFFQTDGLDVSFTDGDIDISGAASGITFDGFNDSSGGDPGSATFFNTVNVGPDDATGISMQASTGDVMFDDAHITTNGFPGIDAQGVSPTDGSLNVSGTLRTVAATGIDVSSMTFDTDFASVEVDNRTGTGPALSLNDVPGTKNIGLLDLQSNDAFTPAFDSYHGGTIRVTTSASRILNGAGQAIRFSIDSGVAPNFANMTLDSIAAAGSADGVQLTELGGVLTIAKGDIDVTGFGGGFAIFGGSAAVSYGGEIQTAGGSSVFIQDKTGGTVTFSGPITDAGTGISLQNNTNTTIDFTGDLLLNTTTSAAFTAIDAGVINVTAANNTIATTTGQGVEISGGTVIGAGGVSFLSVSASNPIVGIRVDGAGTGAFAVTGDGVTPGSGGIIVSADTAVIARNNVNVMLTNMSLEGSNGGGISAVVDAGASLALTLDGSVIRDPQLASLGAGLLLQVADGGSADIALVNDTIRDHMVPLNMLIGGVGVANANLRFTNLDLIASPQVGGPNPLNSITVQGSATVCADWSDVRTTRGALDYDWRLSQDSGAFGFVGFQTDLPTTFFDRRVQGHQSTEPLGPPVLSPGVTQFGACSPP